jgi:hypothetical protein
MYLAYVPTFKEHGCDGSPSVTEYLDGLLKTTMNWEPREGGREVKRLAASKR